MNVNTGQITAIDELVRRMHEGTPAERARAIQEAEGYIDIPAAQLDAVRGMNRQQRRAFAVQQRRAGQPRGVIA